MKIPRLSHIISLSAYSVLILVALILLPGADIFTTFLSLLLVWCVVIGLYKKMPIYTEVGRYTLLGIMSILSVGVIANVHYFTIVSGGTTQFPILYNPDAFRFYYDAVATYGLPEGIFCEPKQHGYGLLIVCLWNLTGVTIVAPLVVNILCILLCVMVSGLITWRLLKDKVQNSYKWIVSCAIILTASVCYYVNSGTLLLKDALICLAMSLIILKFTDLMIPVKRLKIKYLLTGCFVVGLLLLMLLRPNYIIYAVGGIMIMNGWRDKRSWLRGLFLILISVAVWYCASVILSGYEMAQETGDLMQGASTGNAFFSDNPQHNYLNQIIGDYLDFPWWKYLLYMPACSVLQFLIPFPWGFEYGLEFGYTLVYARMSYPWYIIGGILLFFVFVKWRKSPKELALMFLWGFLMWLVPVYLFAGTVSRYSLPILPALIPAVVYVISLYKKSRPFYIWMSVYVVAIVVVLIVCYNLQQSAL